MDESLSDFKSSAKMKPFVKEFGKKFKFYDKNRILEDNRNEFISTEQENNICLGQVTKSKIGTHWKQIFINLEEDKLVTLEKLEKPYYDEKVQVFIEINDENDTENSPIGFIFIRPS